VWTDPNGRVLVIYANSQDITAYMVVTSGPGAPRLTVQWDVHAAAPQVGNFTTPVIARNILYVAHNGEVDAYNPTAGKLLWSSKSVAPLGQISSKLHWEYPAAAGGMLFMTDEAAHVYAYRKK
jgi:outer membrane protein assembly factor BamB